LREVDGDPIARRESLHLLKRSAASVCLPAGAQCASSKIGSFILANLNRSASPATNVR
jgi:hypothetical protein